MPVPRGCPFQNLFQQQCGICRNLRNKGFRVGDLFQTDLVIGKKHARFQAYSEIVCMRIHDKDFRKMENRSVPFVLLVVSDKDDVHTAVRNAAHEQVLVGAVDDLVGGELIISCSKRRFLNCLLIVLDIK